MALRKIWKYRYGSNHKKDGGGNVVIPSYDVRMSISDSEETERLLL